MTSFFFLFFFFNDTATTEIYTLSLHDALPISNDDGMAMLDEVLEDLLQVHFLRRPVDQSEHDRAEGRLHLRDRKSTRLNSSHSQISYAVFCLKKKKNEILTQILD